MNKLNEKVTLLSLFKSTLPTATMMVFFAVYSIVDGMFVSRFVGSNALSAVNIVYPLISLLIGISVMFATGGNAIVSRLMGEKKEQKAREIFSLIFIVTIITGIIIGVISIIFIKPIIMLLGSTDSIYDYCKDYLMIFLIYAPFMMVKLFFDYFYVTVGKAGFGLAISVFGGILNIILDYVFIVIFDMGVAGAGYGTIIGYAIPALIGLVFFMNKKRTLYITKPIMNIKALIDSCINGSSEMVTQLATAVTTYLYNIAMLKYLGEDGVAAITVILYIQFLLSAAYIGFTSGAAPRIGYNYGAENKEQIQKLIKYSFIIIGTFSIISFIIAFMVKVPLTALFCGKGTTVYNMTIHGFDLFSVSFLLCGFNIFTCGMFTAFSNGRVSGLLSLFRTFIFFIIGIIILPYFLEVDGVWLVAVFAELFSLILSVAALIKYKDEYGYSTKLKMA
ncbi:MATE family efflux transporter [Clostridium sp. SM-530-WT-3G]|uniref:MATE family efflux transporter n=1 Tax=Clostridium sp. SM-530-WT-3G TaxID=2725303 RepID=UPI001FAD0869|nr:MATE family efflux transporter [Clostridium sp. SM-530-WT-3G]